MRWTLAASMIAPALLAMAACDRAWIPGAGTKQPPEFLISTLSAPPARTVKKTFGFYCRWFSYAGGDYGPAVTAGSGGRTSQRGKKGGHALIKPSGAASPPPH